MTRKFLIAGIALSALTGCCPPVKYIDMRTLTLSDLSEGARSLHGKEVTVAGFLVANNPDLALYISETRPTGRGVPWINVEDVALRAQTDRDSDAYGESFLLSALGCTDKYVRITGIVGRTMSGAYGIARIGYIRTFDSMHLQGQGTQCFPAPE